MKNVRDLNEMEGERRVKVGASTFRVKTKSSRNKTIKDQGLKSWNDKFEFY